MSTRARPRPPRRGPRAVRLAVLFALLAVVFLAGLAVGQALEDNPDPGGTQTQIRTLQPLELAPERETITVTVSSTP